MEYFVLDDDEERLPTQFVFPFSTIYFFLPLNENILNNKINEFHLGISFLTYIKSSFTLNNCKSLW